MKGAGGEGLREKRRSLCCRGNRDTAQTCAVFSIGHPKSSYIEREADKRQARRCTRTNEEKMSASQGTLNSLYTRNVHHNNF